MCDVWRKVIDWLFEFFAKGHVSDAGREVESTVEARS